MYSYKRIILGSFTFIVANAGRALIVLFVILCVGHGASLVPRAKNYGVLKKVMNIQTRVEAPVTKYLSANIPTKLSGMETAPYIFMVSLFVVWVGISFEKDRLDNMKFALVEEHEAVLKLKALSKQEKDLEVAKAKAEREAARAQAIELAKTQKDAAKAMNILGKAKNIGRVGVGKDATLPPHGSKREELLELYARTKKTLEESRKDMAFLAIDVVNSTGMKKGEDSALAERDFRQYKHVVEKAIADNGGIKSAWTPDGVMICFATIGTAVSAAKQVIRDLDHFNKNVKSIKADFQVRTGINAGKVLFDDEVPMEEMSDRAIDIAGHMQKYAGVNSIFIGKEAIDKIPDHGFRPVGKQVDGLEVYSWESGSQVGASA